MDVDIDGLQLAALQKQFRFKATDTEDGEPNDINGCTFGMNTRKVFPLPVELLPHDFASSVVPNTQFVELPNLTHLATINYYKKVLNFVQIK